MKSLTLLIGQKQRRPDFHEGFAHWTAWGARGQDVADRVGGCGFIGWLACACDVKEVPSWASKSHSCRGCRSPLEAEVLELPGDAIHDVRPRLLHVFEDLFSQLAIPGGGGVSPQDPINVVLKGEVQLMAHRVG